MGQFSFPAAHKKTIPLPRRPPVVAIDAILFTTFAAHVFTGDEPHELESTSTLSFIKSNTVIILSSLINNPPLSDSHFIGNNLHPGAAPTARDASTSAAITPEQHVP